MRKILTVLSLLVIIALVFSKGINMQNMIEEDNNGDSYADISAFIYVGAGLILTYIAYCSVGLNIKNPLAIIPYGIGISSLIYGLFLLSVKGII